VRISLVTRLYIAPAVALSGVVAVAVWWRHSQFTAISNLLNADVKLFLSRTLFHIGGQPVRVFFIIKAVVFLVFLNLVARAARSFLSFAVRNNPRVDKHREYLASKAITLAIYVVGILVGIQVENINFTTLAIIGGTLGVGVGFGLQSLVSNCVAGLILLFEQPIHLGDRIEFGERAGEVVRVGSRSSSIRTYDNAILIVPNSDFVTKQILNWTASDPKSRITIPVSVAYKSDPQSVMRNLLELASEHSDVMKDPSPVVELSELTPSAVNFFLRSGP
jgi:small-conductance mechanosensitive channel